MSLPSSWKHSIRLLCDKIKTRWRKKKKKIIRCHYKASFFAPAWGNSVIISFGKRYPPFWAFVWHLSHCTQPPTTCVQFSNPRFAPCSLIHGLATTAMQLTCKFNPSIAASSPSSASRPHDQEGTLHASGGWIIFPPTSPPSSPENAAPDLVPEQPCSSPSARLPALPSAQHLGAQQVTSLPGPAIFRGSNAPPISPAESFILTLISSCLNYCNPSYLLSYSHLLPSFPACSSGSC